MKEYKRIHIILISLVLSVGILNAVEKIDISAVFPVLDGWNKKGTVAEYNPDNLYEYIDGAADIFLSYDFQTLVSLTYENAKNGSFSVDIYRHNNERNGYGIYSQEKPQKDGNFLPVGTQGYYEKGVLNFLKGSYYVKLSGYDLGDSDKEVLTTVAKMIAERLEGSVNFPTVLKCFPEKGKQAGTEKYIAQNFMGHSFLNSSFTADYELNGQKFQVFIIETDDAKSAAEILGKYRDFVTKKGMEVSENGAIVRFEDPYYRSNGKMNLEIKGNYLFGLFSKDEAVAKTIIEQIEKNLVENKSI